MIVILSIFILIIYILYIFVLIEPFSNNGIYTAIIIEPREHKALELVLTNFTNNLDDRWNFIIFHGSNNINYIKNIIQTKLKKHSHRIKLHNLNVSNLTIKDYNNIFFDKNFYNNIPTETFLVFQTDTFICKKHKDLIYNFIKYDYTGAPWIPTHWNNQQYSVGNGGLSLRKKSKMLELLNNCKHNGMNEDLFFSNIFASELKCNVVISKPSVNDAKNFSIEHIYNDKSFGVHKPWLYIDKKIDHCENLDTLINLNK